MQGKNSNNKKIQTKKYIFGAVKGSAESKKLKPSKDTPVTPTQSKYQISTSQLIGGEIKEENFIFKVKTRKNFHIFFSD